MAYTDKQRDSIFEEIVSEIEDGSSLIAALSINGRPSTSTFYIWLESDDEKSKRYACACEARELKMLDEILEIADKQGEDVIHTDSGDVINHNVIQRSKLQIEARQWVLGKLRPEKYGNKTTLAGDKENPIDVNFNLKDVLRFDNPKS